MSIKRKDPEQPVSPKIRLPKKAEALRLINHWLKTDYASEDISDWEDLKTSLNQNRSPGRKLFVDE